MSLDCDVALLGTGVAPLIAANVLVNSGKRVFILNPDLDFFREDSELPIDPFLVYGSQSNTEDRLETSGPERTMDILGPHFPGSIEYSTADGKKTDGFRDKEAPQVRARSRVWIRSQRALANEVYLKYWDDVEGLFIRASENELNPSELEGIRLASLVPGFSGKSEVQTRGISIPKLVDTDVVRYRNGLLEFIREKVDPASVVCEAHHIELMSEGIRYYVGKTQKTVKIKNGFMVFWTPQLSRWIHSQLGSRMKKAEFSSWLPQGLRMLEQWSLVSRDPLRSDTAAVFEDMVLWADLPGPVDEEYESKNLNVLRVGELAQVEDLNLQAINTGWATMESFSSLSRLCQEFLGWEKFTVRGLKPRIVLEWSPEALEEKLELKLGSFETRVVQFCDGFLPWVAKHATDSARSFL